MADESVLLHDLVENHAPMGSVIGPDEVASALRLVGIEDHDEITMQVNSAFREWAQSSDQLEFRPSGWRVPLTDKIAQTALISAIIWGALLACGVTAGIPAAIVPSVIPCLFSIERVRLKKSQESVLASLTLSDRCRSGTREELYASLSPAIQAELSYLDFVDFINDVVRSGHGKADEADNVTLFKSGDGRIAISIE